MIPAWVPNTTRSGEPPKIGQAHPCRLVCFDEDFHLTEALRFSR
jgi:hypothetical protein